MIFQDFPYKQPDIAVLREQFAQHIATLQHGATIEAQEQAFDAINLLRQEFDAMFNLCYIRHTINTKDKFYAEQNTFFDEQTPHFQELLTDFYRALLASPLRDVLEKRYGKQWTVIAASGLKTFSPDIIEDLQLENKRASEYQKLKATAKIKIKGQTYTLSQLLPLETDPNRNLRKTATASKWRFFKRKAEKIEQIFDDLVKTRHRIAQKLGYKNFVELGYLRMLRSDYNAQMVANFRQQVQEHIVPLASELYKRQAKRLNLRSLKYFDEEFKFPSGNAAPKGDVDWIVERAATMYHELSPETDHFFSMMQSQQLMDLVSRDNKATGGYCTYISSQKVPFIFANTNGTSGDIDVLTHEAGHAFQVYESRNQPIPEYNWPTYESCEIHSMSMEFFTWPWMHLFFEKDVDKYKYAHLAGAIQFLPYGVAVDEFQHVVYENPDMTPAERNAAWREIEKKYLPHRQYVNNDFLEQGAAWQRQNHIFASPFYYIDYTLAQMCAFQFWKRDHENHEEAWSDYVKLCQAGGSDSFLGLVKLAGLRSPFEDGSIAETIAPIKAWLAAVDDSAF